MIKPTAHQSPLSRQLLLLLIKFGLLCALVAPSAQASGRQTVTVMLDETPFSARLQKTDQARLAGRTGGAAAARAAALRARGRSSAKEQKIAGEMEARRNAAMRKLRVAAAGATELQGRMEDKIRAMGGRVISARSGPGSITCEVTPRQLAALSRMPEVAKIMPAGPAPIAMASPVDGSAAWRGAGFFGQAPNPDLPSAPDGPDAAVFDIGNGMTTSHVVFNSRKATDCASCAGTGPSQDPEHPQAGANTRIISPKYRSIWTGGGHANTVGAAIAATDFTQGISGTGIAYGLDKLFDANSAKNQVLWMMGLAYTTNGQTEPGVSDLPEVLNESWGSYHDTEADLPADNGYLGWFVDPLVSQYGIAQTIAGGNCGVRDGSDAGCYNGPHRVTVPANQYNVLSVGAWYVPNLDPSTWRVWQHSSAGPTWDGRKKPDLLASNQGGTSGPNNPGDGWVPGTPVTTYGNTGQGTSYAAPMVAGGVALLASVGVVDPLAQRAILISNARPIQNQTYWTPTAGWGALDLASTFTNRANWSRGALSGAGANSARFFRASSTAPGARTTITWNRRHAAFGGRSIVAPYPVTNIDATQFAPAAPAVSTADFGSDAADTVDTNQTPSGVPDPNAPGKFGPGGDAKTDNPMPGSGVDGEDNIEQLRTKAGVSGEQIIKVKALSAVVGSQSEPFAIAGEHPITAIESPIADVTLTSEKGQAQTGEDVEITATITNPSDELALAGATLTVTQSPAGLASITPSTAALGTLAPGETTTRTFTVRGLAQGSVSLTATASGSAWGETFAGSDAIGIDFDDEAPLVTLPALSPYTSEMSTPASWSASDNLTGVDSFDVEVSVGGGAFDRVIDAGSATTYELTGADGELVRLRVRARDALGNVSAWSEGSTTFARSAPSISFGSVVELGRGGIRVPVSVSSRGVPITYVSYGFGPCGCESWGPLTGDATYTNYGKRVVSAVLVVNATDALGRTAQKRAGFSVGPRQLLPNLRLKRARVGRGRVVLAGQLDARYEGRAVVKVERRGKRGSPPITRKVRAGGGALRVSLRLRPGRYRMTVLLPQAGDFLTQRQIKHFRL